MVATLYAASGTWCLQLLTDAAGATPELFTDALVEAVAEPDLDAVAVLLAAGADSRAPGPDGRSARRHALTAGVPATLDLLGDGDSDLVDQLLEAVIRGDAERARVAAASGLVERLAPADLATLVNAAEHGNTRSVALMLDLGFPIGTRRDDPDDDGATALHAASWAGSADTVALLLERGADLTAVDTRWDAGPLEWALVGSGEAPETAPAPDWVATIRRLLDAGASVDEITIDPADPKAPSAAVVDLLRSRGLVVQQDH